MSYENELIREATEGPTWAEVHEDQQGNPDDFDVETPATTDQNDSNETGDDDLERWVATTLVNDEASTDRELVEHFMEAGPMSYEQAQFYIDQRNNALRHGLTFTLQSFTLGSREGESSGGGPSVPSSESPAIPLVETETKTPNPTT